METDTITRERLKYLERQLHNLSKLVEINGIINSTLDIGRLLQIVMEIIKDIMEAEASTLLLYEEESRDLVFKVALGDAGRELQEKYRISMGQGIAGWVAERRKVVYINDVYRDERFDRNFDKMTGFTTKSILCAPLLFKGKLLGVIQAINPLNKPGFDDEDVVLFNAFGNQAALAVQNAIFFQNAIEEERINNELTAGHSIQASLFPEISINRDGFSIAARSIPAREVGGEFYDVFFSGDSAGIALGDIHSKGIPGALQASIVSGAVKSLAGLPGGGPLFIHRKVNEMIESNIAAVKNVSLFYGVVDWKKRYLSFVNSGIAYPLIVRDGVARYIKIGSKSLGGQEVDLKRVRVELREGDFFVIVTDGLISQKNRNGIQFGLKRIMDFLGGSFSSPDEMIGSLLSHVDDFTGRLERKEDISIIAFTIS